MPLTVGSHVILDGDPLKMGTSQLDKVYMGSNLVWENYDHNYDITASTDELSEITVDWIPHPEAIRHALFRDNVEIAYDQDPPYYDNPGDYVSHTYKVQAHFSGGGSEFSAEAVGQAVEPPIPGSVIVDYTNFNSEVGSGIGSVTKNADGFFSFTPPANVTSVTYSITAAGGSGSVALFDAYHPAGGGSRGQELCGVVEITPDVISITIGLGGAVVHRNYQSATNGNPGNISVFGSVLATGGSGGLHGVSPQAAWYLGMGWAWAPCIGGTTLDGLNAVASYGGQASWGWGGYGSSYPVGGAGTQIVAGAGCIGAGGGGAAFNDDSGHYDVWSGAGGNGQLRLSWG